MACACVCACANVCASACASAYACAHLPTHAKAGEDAEELKERQGNLCAFHVRSHTLDNEEDDGKQDKRQKDRLSLAPAL